MDYRRRGPNPILVIVFAALLVFGGFLVWQEFQIYYEKQETNRQRASETAVVFTTQESIRQATRSFQPFPTSTRVPDCEIYFVDVSSAFVRMCPSLTCQSIKRYPNGADVCVIGRADDNQYFDAEDWFVIDLNFGQLFLEVGYMHESVIKPRNPTPRPSQTFTPLPTITLTPTPRFSTPTPGPEVTGTPTPANRVEF